MITTPTTRRGDVSNGTEVASLILRGVIGGTMIAHGVRHGRTLDGTARWFGGIGFSQPELQARTSVVVEVGAGSAVLIGAATPLAAAAVIGTMAVAARSVHLPNGFFITKDGYEYVLTMAAASAALATIGPGPLSVDAALGQAERFRGPKAGLAAIAIGLAGAAAQLATFWRRPVPSD
jgi:putative oxidoreductase